MIWRDGVFLQNLIVQMGRDEGIVKLLIRFQTLTATSDFGKFGHRFASLVSYPRETQFGAVGENPDLTVSRANLSGSQFRF
jgi:hypothetical protein